MPARHLEGLSGKAISAFQELLEEVGTLDAARFRGVVGDISLDRLGLAEEFLDAAQRVPSDKSVDHRVAVCRSYYAMYQAARSVVFAHAREDIDDHFKLPQNLPDDFPDRRQWVERLRFWRVKRNDLDYSPYVSADDDLEELRRAGTKEAGEFCRLARAYVEERGAP
jgi:hypothetical protein